MAHRITGGLAPRKQLATKRPRHTTRSPAVLRTCSIDSVLFFQFNSEIATTQKFSLPRPWIKFIRENASVELLLKLFKSCKSIPKWFPKIICCRMKNPSYIKELPGLPVNIAGSWSSNINRGSVIIATCFYFYDNNDEMALSKFIPKIFRCNASLVEIARQRLTMKELQILIGSENLESLHLWSIKNSDGKEFKVEDILQMTPFVKDIEFYDVQCCADTAKKLSAMKFKNKIGNIYLGNLNNVLLDPYDFAKFITKNCSRRASITINFPGFYPGKGVHAKNFCKIIDPAIKNRWKKNEIDFRTD